MLLSLAMLFTLAPTAFAAGNTETSESKSTEMSGNCGATDNKSNVKWELTKNNEDRENPTYTLTISGSGDMANFTVPTKPSDAGANIAPWYTKLANLADSENHTVPITEVVVQNGVTGLGNWAFAYTQVTKATFTESVKNYGIQLYAHCSELTTVDWTNFAPKKVMLSKDDTTPYEGAAIPGNLFDSDQKLHICIVDSTTYTNTLVVPARVEAVGTSGFYGTSFQTVDFKNNLPDVKQVGYYSFADMQSLKALTIPGYMQFVLGGQDKTLSNAFSEVFNATSMVIEEGIKVIPASMARQWNSMETLQLPSTITKIENRAFDNAKHLHSVDMSKITGSLTVNTAFNTWGKEDYPVNCVFYVNSSKIQAVLSEDDWGTRYNNKIFAITNGGIFPDDTKFEAGKLATPVKDGCVFAGWYENAEFTGSPVTEVQAGKTYYAKWNTAVLSGNCGAEGNKEHVHWALTKNTDGTTYTLTISGSGAMADYTVNINNAKATQPWRESETGVEIEKITKVVVSEDVTSIGAFAFNGMTGVSEYDIGANVNTISQWALDTSAAKVFKLNENTNFITDNNGVLFSKDGTTLIAYPGGSAVRDKYTVPATVTAIEYGAFVGCPIKKLTIGNNVTTGLPSWSFNGGVLEELDVNSPFDQSTFAQITTLKKVTLGDSITEIPELAFFNCTGLQTVSIPSGLKKIGSQAFFGCSSLQNVTLPASLTEIAYQAFRDCDKLTSITFPDSLTKIGESAFSGCTELTYISYGSGIDDIGGNAFGGCTGVKVIDLHRATQIGELYNNGANNGDSALTHACIKDTQYVKYYLRTKSQAESVKGNLEWGKGGAGKGNITNTYYILTATDAVPNYTGQTETPKRAGYTFGKWEAVNDVSQGSTTTQNVYTDANSWSLASPTVTVSPASANTYVGGSAVSLTATVSELVDGFTYSYQWYSNTSSSNAGGTAISNAKGATYSPSIANAGTTYYYCVVKVAKDSNTTSATTEAIPVTVAKQAGSVTISNNKKTTATYGDKSFTFTYTANKAATVTSSNPSVATVKDNNRTVTVTIVGAGTTEISVGFAGDTDYSAASKKFTLTVDKATPSIKISADQTSLTGSGTVKLTVTPNGVPTEGKIEVICDGITVTKNKDGTFSATLPNQTKTYTFTASYAGDDNHAEASNTCQVSVTRHTSSSGSSNPTYSVTTPSKSENGGVAVSSKNARKGDTVTVTVTPDAGYQLDKLTVTDKDGKELKLTDKGDGQYTFTMPDGKVEVKAVFAKKVETSPFGDVSADAYYYKAVQWAQEKGITDGISSNLFGPKQPCTRSQIVTFLWRAAGSPEPKGTAAGMTDVVPGSYYAKAVAWAVENGITSGTAEGTFSPDATCTRAQAVTFLARAQNAKATGKTAFSDVPADSYFADAVAWAQANGVTTGTSETTFSPDNDCTRAQIVTFLYRANQGT